MNGDKLQLRLYISPRFASGDSLRKRKGGILEVGSGRIFRILV